MIRKILEAFVHPGHAMAGLVRKYWYLFPDDEKYLKLVYRFEMGHKLNLKNPTTFTEKLQWLKLYDRKPEYTKMVDKITAKEYVASIIGKQYIIPTLGFWNHFDEIDFTKLPNKFVLKTNHGSGGCGVVLCRDKATFDFEAVRRKLEGGLYGNTYNKYREWPYKDIKPKIFAETLMEEEAYKIKTLNDYKFFCFNGKAKVFKIDIDRFENHQANYYDRKGNLLPFGEANFPYGKQVIALPENMNEMLLIADRLSSAFTFVRVDLYSVGERIYFSELTFYPASGLERFMPEKYDYILGEMMMLPIQK